MIPRILFMFTIGLSLAACGGGEKDMVVELCQEQLATIRGGDAIGDSKKAKACECALEKVDEEVGDKLDEWLATYVSAWNAQKQRKVDGVENGRRTLATMSWHLKMCTGL